MTHVIPLCLTLELSGGEAVRLERFVRHLFRQLNVAALGRDRKCLIGVGRAIL